MFKLSDPLFKLLEVGTAMKANKLEVRHRKFKPTYVSPVNDDKDDERVPMRLLDGRFMALGQVNMQQRLEPWNGNGSKSSCSSTTSGPSLVLQPEASKSLGGMLSTPRLGS